MRRRLVLPVLVVLASPILAAPSLAAHRAGTAPSFREYVSPIGAPGSVGVPLPDAVQGVPAIPKKQNGLGDRAGEPTLGIDPRTGAVLFQSVQQTLRVTGFDGHGPGTSVWQDATDIGEGAQSADPILFTDQKTGRTWVNQLLTTQCSLQAYSDDDGKSWQRSALGCGPGIAFDHQTIVSGPKAEAGLLPSPVGYPSYLYYCTNDAVAADCAVSLDGGLSFLPATPVFRADSSNCATLFGHIKTDTRGRVYLPPDGCGREQGIYVSSDNTASWTYRAVPDSGRSGDAGHPSLAVSRDGVVYYAWGSSDAGTGGTVHVAVSPDTGTHWQPPAALGGDVGVVQSRFPLAVVGDADRAVVGFLGTKTGGNANDPGFKGSWRLYLSFTYDRGRTWKTYDATGHAPIQVGPVCTLGTVACLGTTGGTTLPVGVSSPTRNLLDFNDMVLDPNTGRVLVALARGCLKNAGCTTADRASKAVVVREVAGEPLLRHPGKAAAR